MLCSYSKPTPLSCFALHPLTKLTIQFQIYESNAEPRTYAVNYQYTAPNKEVKNEIIASMGSSFSIAFRIFKKAFKERTGVEWDDRITAAIEHRKDQKRDRGISTGSEDLGSQKGVAVCLRPSSLMLVLTLS
jgi:hypothetical protein